MPKAFDTWQVFPHDPLEKLEPNLWRVQGVLPGGNGHRVMTIAKMRDGGLVIHNAIALEDELMKQIEEFGKPAWLVVPNGFHRLDARVFKDRYPHMKVTCPAGARKKVAQVVPVDATLQDAPQDDDLELMHLEGTKEGEPVMKVKSDDRTTLVFTDAVNNLPKTSGFMGFLLSPTGLPAVPRIARWMMMKDKVAFRGHLEKLAATPNLKRIIVAHGTMMTEQPRATLEKVASVL
jgi:hypothetical protein